MHIQSSFSYLMFIGYDDVDDISTSSSSHPACKYGADCYRTDARHLAAYTHPKSDKKDKRGMDTCACMLYDVCCMCMLYVCYMYVNVLMFNNLMT